MSSNDSDTTTNSLERKPSNSIFFTVIASAISSVGFGVSIVAIGVLWLFPSALGAPNEEVLEQLARHKAKVARDRRRSAPADLTRSRRKSARSPPNIIVPVVIPSSKDTPPSSSGTSRKVYFLEPQPRPRTSSRRYSAPLTGDVVQVESQITAPVIPGHEIPEGISPLSSSSTLVHIPLPSSHPSTLDPCEEVVESDTSSSQSHSSVRQSRLSSTIPERLRGRWGKRTSTSPSPTPGVASAANKVQEPSPVIPRKTTFGFNPWSTVSKPRLSEEPPIPPPSTPFEPATSKRTPSISEAFFPRGRKSSANEKPKRLSTPQRTQPYAYPYFAEPPIPREELSSPAADPRSPESTKRREQREKNAEAQAALGLGRRPPSRRAMSAAV